MPHQRNDHALMVAHLGARESGVVAQDAKKYGSISITWRGVTGRLRSATSHTINSFVALSVTSG
jgi:hypothetical protein